VLKLRQTVRLKTKDLEQIDQYLSNKDYKGLHVFLVKRIKYKERSVKLVKESELRYKVSIDEIAKERRDELVKEQTPAEAKFKALLKLNGVEYEFQKIIFYKQGKKDRFFIPDFYLPKYNIVIELDGKYHNDIMQQDYDKNRTKILVENGIYRVVRFTNKEVLTEQDIVKLRIVDYKIEDLLTIETRKFKRRKPKVHKLT
jgi:very-short-patch-repair endonuclease